ncbi:MAG: hypothetical protein OSA48_02270 [Akkermansiaceae bacterium]|nr:hypothetical protein [Akkermansiaceae bacterium]
MSLLSRILGSLTTATTVFAWDGTSVTFRKGKASSRVTLGLQSLLRETHSPSGTISLRKDGRISFSDSLNPSLHQRLRNIIHNEL